MFLSYSAYPDYNIRDNMVSDLGIGPLGIFFNLGFIFSGLLAIPYYLNLSYHFQKEGMDKRLVSGSVVSSLVSCIAYSFVGVFPAIESNFFLYYTHGIVAGISVMSGTVYLLFFAYMMYVSKSFKKGQAIFTVIICVFYFLFLFTWIPIIEWTASFGIMGWIFLNSLYLLFLNKSRTMRNKNTNNNKLDKA